MARKPRHKNLEDFKRKAIAVHGDNFDYSKATLIGKKVRLFCEKCQAYFECSAEYHIQPHRPNRPNNGGCKPCGYALAGKKHHKPYDKVLLRWEKAHGKAYDYSKAKKQYRSLREKVDIRCKSCDIWFTQRAESHCEGAGCPQCHWMKSERVFAELISQKGLKPLRQRPKWLVNPDTGHALELDFYFPELGVAIEVQGRQHYEPIDIFGGLEKFKKQQKHDQMKRFLCFMHGVILHEYDLRKGRKHEDIEAFLNTVL